MQNLQSPCSQVMGSGAPHYITITMVVNQLWYDPYCGGYSILYDASKSYYGKLARKLIRDTNILSLFPKQLTHKKKFRTNLEQFIYNLLICRTEQRWVDQNDAYTEKDVRIAVSLWKMFHDTTRYKLTFMSHRHVSRLLNSFKEFGWIEVIPGSRRDGIGFVTRFRAIGMFAKMLDRYLDDLNGNVHFYLPAESVVLKDESGLLVDYTDDDDSVVIRSDLEGYNNRTASHTFTLLIPIALYSITQLTTLDFSDCVDSEGLDNSDRVVFSSSQLSPSSSPSSPSSSSSSSLSSITQHTSPQDPETKRELAEIIVAQAEKRISWLKDLKPVVTGNLIVYDLHEYHIHHKRVYNRGSWDYGGRYYAAYQNLPKECRTWLRIDGEPVVELDYSSLHAHMLYHSLGLEPDGDPYTLDLDVPRKSVKRIFFVLLNAKNYQSLYRYLHEIVIHPDPNVRLDLNGYTPKEVVNALKKKHHRIAQFFHADQGITLQNQDSILATRILDRIDALVVHDSFIVTACLEAELRAIMQEEYRRMFGFDIRVD